MRELKIIVAIIPLAHCAQPFAFTPLRPAITQTTTVLAQRYIIYIYENSCRCTLVLWSCCAVCVIIFARPLLCCALPHYARTAPINMCNTTVVAAAKISRAQAFVEIHPKPTVARPCSLSHRSGIAQPRFGSDCVEAEDYIAISFCSSSD